VDKRRFPGSCRLFNVENPAAPGTGTQQSCGQEHIMSAIALTVMDESRHQGRSVHKIILRSLPQHAIIGIAGVNAERLSGDSNPVKEHC